MSKNKEFDNKERKNYTLGKRIVDLISHYTKVEAHKNHSQFIEYLVEKHNAENNPAVILKALERDKESVEDQLKNIDKKRKEVIKKMQMKKEADEVLREDKERAIDTIIKSVRRGKTLFELQNYIKTWCFRLNMSYEELSFAVALRMKQEKVRTPNNSNEVSDGEYERGGVYFS